MRRRHALDVTGVLVNLEVGEEANGSRSDINRLKYGKQMW